ncbi:MAG: bifunctional glutamine synthetase adenylyltransferase/deadenyltransferase [Polynucleobacter sp. 24-46-87]|uniref:bifunctional [glutamate--ammonia ligase]-adenylyl-L-tyrosine phosphorylase/[glutamate--ammonia-ligase] adenylyltransferase n=1 Tax=unclassified Polynucleobacter TaxID=2640945 RepID=UPI000BD5CE10|nr:MULTISPECIES: bifunctional [glutamate--ammonia ligase]-adenylyl-L-tyrosine phosphorylase/[glutamate--ammonia-ligase] adenylyltransferase [unclassified Polynucleobacter]OYY18448.1 MAG: bifunctional glutamine synthetase adenylyltransferase/deadenyltransferase [Polynucleobacter sp. 35-46-11]OZA14955.1 MAG: bifunctional glutamine synthetase adenylyltransferase/deadenyltransferase [Polynucleobacter sp. 24-46-87]OZA76605.1 MAG: bifunctional glutamine synthetase adenylyltransferase/deadenyltransfera
MTDFAAQIEFLKQHSSYAQRWLHSRPEWVDWLRLQGSRKVDVAGIRGLLTPCEDALAGSEQDEVQFMADLRLARQRLMLWVAFRDLNGISDLSEVTHALSHFAQETVALSIAYIREDLQRRFGLPWSKVTDSEMPLMVVGMGKLGGLELNLSSDIDLIFLYEHEGDTQGGPKSMSYHEWFTRMGKRLIKLLAEHDANGFVFRVDMRLRPNGDSGPLVCSLDMLEEYLLVQGREWERYAWIKGRLIAPLPDSPSFAYCDRELDQLIRPFVYRRHLDYGVVASIRELHAQIQHEAEKRSSNHHGRSRDIKLGRGGIREIEFLAQMFQLMRGGTDPRFRIRPTLEVLDLVKQQGILPANEVDDLKTAYVYLRRLEHRIQVWEDQQTHYLPEDEGARTRLAASMGGPDQLQERIAFISELDKHQAAVAQYFEKAFVLDNAARLDNTSLPTGWEPDSALFPESAGRWLTWADGSKQRQLSEKSRIIFNNLIRKAADSLEADQPAVISADQTLLRFFDLLEAVARRSAYLSILSEYPQALSNVLALLKASQWGAEYLTRHPHLLDYLLNSRTEKALIEQPEQYWREVKTTLDMRLDDVMADGDGSEQAMDILRITHHTETFITLLADLGIGVDHELSVEKVSDHLSALADLILQTTFERVWPGVVKKFELSLDTTAPFAVISYGKLGGKELGYASDLDLVFLYQAEETDFAAQEIYALLAKRMINWLTAYTSAGSLFEIDTRLRPNGSAGFLVTNTDAFKKYQLREGDNAAWVWEHQALTRARFSAGSEAVGAFFDDVRFEVLSQRRDVDQLRHEILEMRRKVHAGHPNPTPDFDLKHDAGGMVDIEFIVQFLVLAYSNTHPQLIGNLGNIALLRIAGDVGLIHASIAQQVGDAYRLLRARQHRLRLDGAEKTRVDLGLEPQLVQAREVVLVLWQEVFLASSNA